MSVEKANKELNKVSKKIEYMFENADRKSPNKLKRSIKKIQKLRTSIEAIKIEGLSDKVTEMLQQIDLKVQALEALVTNNPPIKLENKNQ